MKHIALVLVGLFLVCNSNIADAGLLTVQNVTSSSTNFNNDVSLLTDGFLPPEGTDWQTGTNIWWEPEEIVFTLDYGMLVSIDDIKISVDNNDDYSVEYSVDGLVWTNLFEITADMGNVNSGPGSIPYGMDTFTTFIADPSEFYEPMIDFQSSIDARYLQIRSSGGDYRYALGEFQAYSKDIPPSPVPEPSTMAFLGLGLASIAGYLRRKQ